MTLKIFTIPALILALAVGYVTQSAAPAFAQNASALSQNLRGLPVTLTDGTPVGILRSSDITMMGHARMYIDTKGYNDVVRTSDTLILTASTRRVAVTDRGVTIDVIRERLINNVSRNLSSGRYVRATILN